MNRIQPCMRNHALFFSLAAGTLLVPVYASASAAQTGASAKSIVTLAELRGHARPVLVFAPSPTDPQLRLQLSAIGDHAPDAAERDIVVVAVLYNGKSSAAATMTVAEAAAVRHRFHISSAEFAVLLLGKDGGEKLRSARPIPWEKLRSTIDAMPMRQEEMRRKPVPG